MEKPPGYPLVNVAMEGSRHSGALSTGPFKREWELSKPSHEVEVHGYPSSYSQPLLVSCTYTHCRGLPGLLSRGIAHCIAPERLD